MVRSTLTGALLGVLAGLVYMICYVLLAAVVAVLSGGEVREILPYADLVLWYLALYVFPPWSLIGAVVGAASGAVTHLLRRQRVLVLALVLGGLTLGTVAVLIMLLESRIGGIEDSAKVGILVTSAPVFVAAALLNARLVRRGPLAAAGARSVAG
jgi:hypothetical protein